MIKENNEKIRIKQCPFNHDGVEDQNLLIREVGQFMAVQCGVCGASGPVADTEDGAVSMWNKQQVVIIPQEAYDKLIGEEDGDEEKELKKD